MRIEIVAYQYNPLRIWIDRVCQPFHLPRPVHLGPVFQGCDMTVAGKWLREQEYAASPVVHVLAVLNKGAVAFAVSPAGLCQQLQRFFVHAYHGTGFVIWTAVHLQDVLHAGGECRTLLLGDTPFLDQVRLLAVPFQDSSNRGMANAVYVTHFHHPFRQQP